MILEEILDYVAVEHLDDRSDILEGDDDRLWSDETIVRFLNDGQRILARRSWVIIETGVAPAGVITLQTSKAVYPLHKSVLRVYKATPSDSEFRLARVSEEALDTRPLTDADAPFDINVAETSTPGYPRAIATDAGTRKLRVFPAPSATEIADGLKLNLKVARMPIKYLDVNDMKGCPEVPEEYHMALGDYAAGRCLRMRRADPDARADGRRLVAEFEAVVKEARQERQRAEAAPIRFAHASTTALV